MSAIAKRLSQVVVGEPAHFRNLTVYPLMADGPQQPEYRLLEAALADGSARVTEVSEGGSVPELCFVNQGKSPVLLLDGEELLGAKQNRILNLSILAPAGKTIVIPVSCVEAGRWHAVSAEFSSARRAHFASGRARKTRHEEKGTEGIKFDQRGRAEQRSVVAPCRATGQFLIPPSPFSLEGWLIR